MPDQLNIAVFASGKGSNLLAILNAIRLGNLHHAHIVAVISNKADAGALTIARENKIPAFHRCREDYASDEKFNESLIKILVNHRVNFIVLAGYLKKIDPTIVKSFRNRIINIHPALLPEFGGLNMYGLHVHEAVLASRATQSGATVHIVDEEYDHGPIVLQKTVPVELNDTPEVLAKRVLNIEHEIYPQAIRLFAEGRVSVIGGKVTIRS